MPTIESKEELPLCPFKGCACSREMQIIKTIDCRYRVYPKKADYNTDLFVCPRTDFYDTANKAALAMP